MRRVVLVVEDNGSLRETYCYVLEELGYRVIEANDSKQALELLRGGLRPSAVFLDYRTPRMNGREFLELVSADPSLASVPIVLTTGWTFAREDLDGWVRLAREVLYKPFDIDALAAAIARHAIPAWKASEAPR